MKSTVSRPHKRVLLVGHFTPPVHGMAVAMDALGDLFATVGQTERIRTVPERPAHGRLYHVTRACLVSRAAIRLAALRTDADVVLLSVDAGLGMLYVIFLTWMARRLGYGVVLQHHSYAYISKRSRLAAALVRVGGSRTHHLHSCQLACDAFRTLYPRVRLTRPLSVAYALAEPPQSPPFTGPPALLSRRLRVGHLSNLTVDKGLAEVIRFGRAALEQGKIEKVILAGPFEGSAERALLDAIRRERGFDYRGPVFGQMKESFFQDIDLFLFPSRYRNESYGLVAWEAMLRGVPVVAYRAGCLTQTSAGKGSLVLEPGEDFTTSGLRRIDEWITTPTAFADAVTAAVAVARVERQRAVSDALELASRLFAASPRRALGTTAQ